MIKELENAIEAYKKLGNEAAVTELMKLAELTDEQQQRVFDTAKKIIEKDKKFKKSDANISTSIDDNKVM